MSGKVNDEAYLRLLDITGRAGRRGEQAAIESAIAVAAGTDPEEFDATVDYLESVMRETGDSSLVLRSVKLVVHDAREAGVPLLKENGDPLGIGEIQLAIHQKRAAYSLKLPTKKKKRQRRQK